MRARLSGPPADPRIYRKAAALLARFDHGEKVYTKTYRRKYLKININPWWRILSKDGGANWRLMTHATFNDEVNR